MLLTITDEQLGLDVLEKAIEKVKDSLYSCEYIAISKEFWNGMIFANIYFETRLFILNTKLF